MHLKILITGTTGESMPPPYGGIPKVCLLYSKVWKKMGHEVGIVFTYRPQNANDLGADVKYFFEYNSKPNKFKKFFFFLKYLFLSPLLYLRLFVSYFIIYPRISYELILYSAYGVFIDKIILTFKPDIILSETALIKTFMAAKVANYRRVPILFDTYAEIRDLSMGVNAVLDKNERTKYWKSFLKMAEFVFGLSNCSDGALLYLPREKVKIFYDVCDFNFYNSLAKEDIYTLRKHFNMSGDFFLVGSVGAYEFRKGHDYLIKAVAILSKMGYDIRVALCGAGDPGKWKKLAIKEGIEEKVYFFKDLYEEELAKFYKTLNLYVNLSNTPRSCGLDLALLEAMSSGLPIIVYDNGILPEAVIEGKNGFVVRTGDIDNLSRAILKIYNMTDEELVIMGRESSLIAFKYDINRAAEIKLNWIKEAIISFNNKSKSNQ